MALPRKGLPRELCRCFRTKNLYTGDPIPESLFTTPCWCVTTMTGLGPDSEQVDDQTCRKGRECFEAQE